MTINSSGDSALRLLAREPLADGPGDGRRLVLVHGSMDRATSFTRLMAKLPDWSIVAYDRRGYAGSSGVGPPSTFAEQVSDLLEVLGDGPATVFGHSYGGDVVLATAWQHPEVISAAMVWEPPQPWLAWWPQTTASGGGASLLEPEEQAEWFMRRMVGDRIWERLPESTRAQRRAEGPTFRAEMETIRDVTVFVPEEIRIPVLVGRGGKSHPHQRRSARELAASLPRGELCEIPDAAHGAHLTHPGELADLVRRAAGATI